MKKKRRKLYGLALLIPGVLLSLAGIWQALQIPDRVEYILPAAAFAPGTETDEALKELGETLEGFSWSAAFRCQRARLSSARLDSGETALYAAGEGYFDLHHETLEEGRFLSHEDYSGGAARAVVNRAAAEAFFGGLEPLGQTLKAGSLEAEVVGVTAGGFRPGEAADAVVWTSGGNAEGGPAWETLEIQVRTADHAESAAAGSLLSAWAPGGSLYDFGRLSLGALMPLWLTGLVLAWYLLKALARQALSAEKRLFLRLKEGLRERYPGQMKARTAGTALACLGITAAGAACVYGFLVYAAIPLYTFTDWIPEAFVDPASVAATARRLLAGAASSTVLRSRTVSAAALAAAWTGTGCLLAALGAAALGFAPARKRKEPLSEGG